VILIVALSIFVLVIITALMFIAARRESVGLFLMLATFVYTTAISPFPTLPFVESLNIYPEDLLFTLLLFAGVIGFGIRPHSSRMHLVLGVVGLLILFSFIRGVMNYSLKSSGVQVRPFFYFFAAAFYCSSFRRNERRMRGLAKLWGYACAILVGVAVIGWLTVARGLPWQTPLARESVIEERVLLRVLDHAPTLFLCQGAILIGQLSVFRRKALRTILVIVLCAVTLFMQHRTIWIVGLAVLCAVGLKRGMRTGRPLLFVSALLALSAVALVVAETSSENVLFRSLDASVAETGGEHSTMTWRYEGWSLLLGDWISSSSAMDIATGWSFGASFRRYIDGAWDDTSAHNFYVDTTLRTGLCGLIALLILYGALGVRAFRERRDWRFAFWLLWISQALYYIAYPPTFDQGILLGYLIGTQLPPRPGRFVYLSPKVDSLDRVGLHSSIRGLNSTA
jgi:hypothetical protein